MPPRKKAEARPLPTEAAKFLVIEGDRHILRCPRQPCGFMAWARPDGDYSSAILKVNWLNHLAAEHDVKPKEMVEIRAWVAHQG